MSEKDPYSFYKKKPVAKDNQRKTYEQIMQEVNSTANAQKRQTQPSQPIERKENNFITQSKKPENAPLRFTDPIKKETKFKEQNQPRETFGNKETEPEPIMIQKSPSKSNNMIEKSSRSLSSVNHINPAGDDSPKGNGDEEQANFDDIAIDTDQGQEVVKKKGRKAIHAGNDHVEEPQSNHLPEPDVSKISPNMENATPIEERSIILDYEAMVREKIEDLLKALDEGTGLLQAVQSDFSGFKEKKSKLRSDLEASVQSVIKIQNSEKVSEEGALQKSVNAFMRIVNEYDSLGKQAEYQAAVLHNQILSDAKGSIPDTEVYIASLILKIKNQKTVLHDDLESLDQFPPKTPEAQQAAQNLNDLLNTERLTIESLRDKVNLVLCQLIKEYNFHGRDINEEVQNHKSKVTNVSEIERYIKNAQLQEKNIKELEQSIKTIIKTLEGIFIIPTSNFIPGVLGLTKQATVLTKIENIENIIKSKKESIRLMKIQTRAVFDPSSSDGSHAKLKYTLMDNLETKLKALEMFHCNALELCRGLKEIYHIEKWLLNLYNEKNHLKNRAGDIEATYEPLFNLIKLSQSLKFQSDRGDINKEETSKRVDEYYVQLSYGKSELSKMIQILNKIHESKETKDVIGPPLEYTKDRILKEIKTLDEWSYIIFQLKLKNNDTEGQLSQLDVNTFFKNYQGFCEEIMANKDYKPISSFEKLQEKVIFLKSSCRKKISELTELASQSIQPEVVRKIKKHLTSLSNIDEDVRIIDDCIHISQRTYNVSQFMKKEALEMYVPETGYKSTLQEEYNYVTQTLNIFNKFDSRADRDKNELVDEILSYYIPQLTIVSKLYISAIDLFFKKVPSMNSSMTEQLDELILDFSNSTIKALANIRETEIKKSYEECLEIWKKAAYSKLSENTANPTAKIYKTKVMTYIGALIDSESIYRLYNFKIVRGDLIEIRKKYNEYEKTALEMIIESFEKVDMNFFYNTFDVTYIMGQNDTQKNKWVQGIQTFKQSLNITDSCLDFNMKEKFDYFKAGLKDCMNGFLGLYDALSSRFNDVKKKISSKSYKDLIDFFVDYHKLMTESEKKFQKSDSDFAKVYKYEILEGEFNLMNFLTMRFGIGKSHLADIADLLAMDIEFKALIKKPINAFPSDVTLEFTKFYKKIEEMKKLLYKIKSDCTKYFIKVNELFNLFECFSNELDDSESLTREIEHLNNTGFKTGDVILFQKKVKQVYSRTNFTTVNLLFDYADMKLKTKKPGSVVF